MICARSQLAALTLRGDIRNQNESPWKPPKYFQAQLVYFPIGHNCQT